MARELNRSGNGVGLVADIPRSSRLRNSCSCRLRTDRDPSGRLPAKITAGRWAWIDPTELDRPLRERTHGESKWVTRKEAAALTGCTQWLIQRGIDRGLIHSRRHAPALLRDSVLAYAKRLQDEWISVRRAIALTGIPQGTIIAALRDSRIQHSPGRGRRPTLSRASVEAFARARADQDRPGDSSRLRGWGPQRGREGVAQFAGHRAEHVVAEQQEDQRE